MRVYIAEKPSLGRAIAQGLGGGKESGGCIRTQNGVVTWCFGHILEQYEPEDYDGKYARWRIDDLPILPHPWKNKIRTDAKKQFSVIEKLTKDADEIVNCGDPDREGQLLIDEVLEALGLFGRKPILRMLLSALDKKSVCAALSNLRPNEDFAGLRASALARARADWLIGYNLSRMYTCRAREAGYDDVISVGRVQTPTFGLVALRELESQKFHPVMYFTPQVIFQHANGAIKAKWKTREMDGIDGIDENGKILQRSIAESIIERSALECARIASVSHQKGIAYPTMPYALSALQIEAGKQYGYSPQQVLDAQQALYEKKLTTYPRSDCSYLPESQLADAPEILEHLALLSEDFAKMAGGVDLGLKSRAWNDKKITAHHAIIPTTVIPDMQTLTDIEKKCYCLVAKAYIAQFYPPQEYLKTHIEIAAGNECFLANGKTILLQGWKSIYQEKTESDSCGEDSPAEEDDGQQLPDVQEGDSVSVIEANISEGTTKPPSRYTPATLLKAMKEIHKHVRDKDLANELKECKGIGTEATRAGIIETIQKRGYVAIEKKQFRPTPLGLSFLNVLPAALIRPDLTAQWEQKLDEIENGRLSIDDFSAQQVELLRKLLDGARTATIPPPKNLHPCPTCGRPLRRRKGKNGFFWGCSGFPACRTTMEDRNGRPVAKPVKKN